MLFQSEILASVLASVSSLISKANSTGPATGEATGIFINEEMSSVTSWVYYKATISELCDVTKMCMTGSTVCG